MFSHKNISWTLIGKNVAYTSATSVGDIADGEVALVTAGGTVITTSTDALDQKFRVVQGRGAGLSPRATDLIDPSNGNLVYFKSNRHYNAAEQVTTLGFNGTSGSIDDQNSTEYFLRVNLLEGERTGFGQQEKLYGFYKTDATATEWEIAREVAKNFNENVRKRKEKDVIAISVFDASAATAGTAGIATGEDVNYVNGSDIITAGTSTWTGTPIVGEVVSTDAATDYGYEIVEVIDANTARIHMPYQGATGTDVNSTAYTAATVVDPCGIRLEGVARGFDADRPGHWMKVRFETQLDNFGSTTFTSTQAPTEGQGNYQLVAKEEFMAEGVFGNRYRRDFLHTATIDTDLSGATYYGCLSLRFRDPHIVSGIGPQNNSYKQCKIFVGDGAADSSWSSSGVQAADLLAMLNTILGKSNTYA